MNRGHVGYNGADTTQNDFEKFVMSACRTVEGLGVCVFVCVSDVVCEEVFDARGQWDSKRLVSLSLSLKHAHTHMCTHAHYLMHACRHTSG